MVRALLDIRKLKLAEREAHWKGKGTEGEAQETSVGSVDWKSTSLNQRGRIHTKPCALTSDD